MHVKSVDGRYIEVRRRWFPWRPRKRKIGAGDALDVVTISGGLGGLVASLVFALVILLFGSLILFGVEAILLIALLVPILALARVLWVLPWVVEATRGDEILGVVKIRGWRDSEAAIRDIAAGYEHGEDPFVVRR